MNEDNDYDNYISKNRSGETGPRLPPHRSKQKKSKKLNKFFIILFILLTQTFLILHRGEMQRHGGDGTQSRRAPSMLNMALHTQPWSTRVRTKQRKKAPPLAAKNYDKTFDECRKNYDKKTKDSGTEQGQQMPPPSPRNDIYTTNNENFTELSYSLPPRPPKNQGWTVSCSGNFFWKQIFSFFNLILFLAAPPGPLAPTSCSTQQPARVCWSPVGAKYRRPHMPQIGSPGP